MTRAVSPKEMPPLPEQATQRLPHQRGSNEGLTMQEPKWIEHYRAGAVEMGEVDEGRGPWLVVMDPGHYRLRFFPNQERKTLSVGIDAEWSDDKPGSLANYTPIYESGDDDCQPGDVTISDDGLLSVLPVQRAASHVVIRIGWTAQLPPELVEPIRRAIALAENYLIEGVGPCK